MKRTIILFMLLVGLTWIMSGCGGSSKNASGNSQSSVPSISFQNAAPTSITIVQSAEFTAVVKNDPSNAGVSWSLPCASLSQCGTLSAGGKICSTPCSLHTASGDSVTYAPPATLSGNSQTFQIVAYSTADNSSNCVASITVTGFASNLKGTYVFHAKGSNVDSATQVLGPYEVAGVVTLDGNGGVKLSKVGANSVGGEQTYADSSTFSTDAITGGSYFIGQDGRGTLTIQTANANVGLGGTESFTIAMRSSSVAYLAETDLNDWASGSLELQTSKTPLSGGYAFALNGSDGSYPPIGVTYGGVFNIDQSGGGISGAGSLADQYYFGNVVNCPAPTSGNPPGLSGSVTSPDTFGSVQVNLTACFSPYPIQLTGYIVDAGHIQLVETDMNASGLGTGFSTGGLALSQASQTGKFTGFSGRFVFGISGSDPSNFNNSLTSAGLLAAGSSGNASGFLDESQISNFVAISDGFTATYTVDPLGTGRVDVVTTYNTAPYTGSEFILYQAGSGNGALVVEFDPTLGASGAGRAYPQGASLSFNGKYALALADMPNYGQEIDATGIMAVADPNLTGSLDGFQFSSAALTGTFASAGPDRKAATLLAPNASGLTLVSPASFAFYPIDSTQGFFIETDLSATVLGTYGNRTPLCPTCP